MCELACIVLATMYTHTFVYFLCFNAIMTKYDLKHDIAWIKICEKTKTTIIIIIRMEEQVKRSKNHWCQTSRLWSSLFLKPFPSHFSVNALITEDQPSLQTTFAWFCYGGLKTNKREVPLWHKAMKVLTATQITILFSLL